VHTLGASSAVWAIGNKAFCKVKSWCPGLESEAQTIKFVKERCPQIPVPEVIYEYIDEDRSFLILGRVHGLTLRDAWADLSPSQHDNILRLVHVVEEHRTQPNVVWGPKDDGFRAILAEGNPRYLG
jgi:aminoglycoside phosphotransferase